MKSRVSKWIYWFDEIGLEDIPRVGGKNASLGEMHRELTSGGVKVPYGFAISVEAYRHFLSKNRLEDRLRSILSDLDVKSVENLQKRGQEARQAILAGEMPEDLRNEIVSAYARLGGAPKGFINNVWLEDVFPIKVHEATRGAQIRGRKCQLPAIAPARSTRGCT